MLGTEKETQRCFSAFSDHLEFLVKNKNGETDASHKS